MSLPKYGRYENSGVEWLGHIPAHWSVVQSRRYFINRNEKAQPGDKQLTASQKHGVIYQADFTEMEGHKVMQVVVGADILKHVEPNDFVISMRSFQGGIEWCGLRGCISSAYVMLIPKAAIWAPFFRYLLKSTPYIQALQSTTNLVRDGQALRFSNFAQVPLPLLPVEEQKHIATFLNRETAKIDALIAEQEKLRALLIEKRLAVISHAVTKGLNPHAPMKGSGVAWLGEIPAHWEVKRLKHLGQAIIGLTYDPSDVVEADMGTLVLRASNVQRGKLEFSDNVYVTTEVPDKLRTLSGDILICSRNGSRNLIGKNALIDQDSAGLTFGAFMLVFRGNYNSYLSWVFNSQIFTYQSGTFLTSTINQLTTGNLYGFEIPLPPLDERDEIAEFLRAETHQLDGAYEKITSAISLLKERRSGLIAAAVTGQIDVRGLAPPVATESREAIAA